MSFATVNCLIFLEAVDASSLIHHPRRRAKLMEPIVLFSVQFTMSLLVYVLIAIWYVTPRLSRLPKELALIPLVWVHAFRFVGGTIFAPGAVDPAVPADFRTMIGYGDIITAALAIIALLALHARIRGAIALVWLVLIVGTADTINAIIQSTRDSVFNYPLGLNWLIVTLYVPALIVSSALILIYLIRPRRMAPHSV
jgi:hypothetical protein